MKATHLLIAVMGMIGLAACGGTNTHTTTPNQPAPIAPSAASAAANFDYPATDTPLGSASTTLQAAWQPILTSDGSDATHAVIPGQRVFTAMPAAPTAGQVAYAAQKTSALVQWAEAHGQTGLLHWLLHLSIDPAITNALNQGQIVSDPNCDVFPTAVTVLTPTPQLTAWFAAAGYSEATPVAIDTIEPEGPSCSLIIAGRPVPTGLPANSHLIYGGTIATTAPLGPIFVVTAGVQCNGLPQQIQEDC